MLEEQRCGIMQQEVFRVSFVLMLLVSSSWYCVMHLFACNPLLEVKCFSDGIWKCFCVVYRWTCIHILRAFLLIAARLACKLHECLRREAAAIKIQKNIRCYFAWRTYSQLRLSAITLQTGLRTMAALKEFMFRKQNKATTHIQVG